MMEKQKSELLKRPEFMRSVTFDELEVHRKIYEMCIHKRKVLKEKELEERKLMDEIYAKETKRFKTRI